MKGYIRKIETNTGTSWQITIDNGFDASGKRIRTFKTVSGTKREACDVMHEMMSKFKSGTYVEPSKVTVAQYLKQWLETYVKPKLSPTSYDGYRINIEKHIIPTLGTIYVQQLREEDILNLYSKLMLEGRRDGKGGLSAKSVLYVHRNLKEALQHAKIKKVIERNPAEHLQAPKPKKYKTKIYLKGELKELYVNAKGTELEVPVALAIELGLRRGELLGLQWADVDFENRTININNNLVRTIKGIVLRTPKTDSGSRSLVISESLVEILRAHFRRQGEIKVKLGEHYKDHDLVCCNADGTPANPVWFSRKFAKFLSKHGLKKIRFHDLRHSNATLMLKNGIPAKVASQRLGHSSIGITLDLYSHVMNEMQQDAVDKIEKDIYE